MYETILIPTDGGRKSKKAASHAIELAATLDATVHSLYVMDLPGAPRTPYIYRDEENVKREDRKSTRLNSSHSGESRMPSSA